MHDWTVETIEIEWKDGSLLLALRSPAGPETIVAIGLYDLQIQRAFPWGPSESINSTVGPMPDESGRLRLSIEMQSGDSLIVIARQFQMPS